MIMRWWYAMQRQMDRRMLWPACRDYAEDLDHAKAVFAVHAFNDPGWLALGHDEIVRQINELT